MQARYIEATGYSRHQPIVKDGAIRLVEHWMKKEQPGIHDQFVSEKSGKGWTNEVVKKELASEMVSLSLGSRWLRHQRLPPPLLLPQDVVDHTGTDADTAF